MVMPRRDTTAIVIRIPTELALEVQTLLADPRTGVIPWGTGKALYERLLRSWVAEQKVKVQIP